MKIPRERQTPAQTEVVNCAPLSEVKVEGTPNLEIQVEIKALTQTSVEIDDKGTASGQRVVLSIMVSPIPAGVLENQDTLGGVNLTPPL